MRKYIHHFGNSVAIIFVVDIASYDCMSQYGMEGIGALNEALASFDSMVNSRWFCCSGVILYLNNITQFQEKILHSPLSKYFTDYEGGADPLSAREYIGYRFVDIMELSILNVKTYTYFVDMSDTNVIRSISCVTRDIIIEQDLKMCGLI
jgi:guanine nucleotide-binding protein subunit alpha